jgi:hypothetical protein
VEEKRMANESPERTVLFVLGVVFSITGILMNFAALAAALYGSDMFSANVANTLFLGVVLGVAGHFMGARKLGLASVTFAVFATFIGALLQQ